MTNLENITRNRTRLGFHLLDAGNGHNDCRVFRLGFRGGPYSSTHRGNCTRRDPKAYFNPHTNTYPHSRTDIDSRAHAGAILTGNRGYDGPHCGDCEQADADREH